MLEMREEIYSMAAEHIVFEFAQGISADLSSITDNVIKGTMNPAGTATWTQIVSENEKAIDYLLKEAQENIDS